MAFNKLSLLSVEDINVSQINIQHVQDSPAGTASSYAKDIFYHLGTNLNQASWSNPAGGSYLNLTTNDTTDSANINNIIDRNINISFRPNPVTLPLTITFEFLTGFEVDLQAFRYSQSGTTSYLFDTFTWQGSNDGTNWEVIYNENELWERNGAVSTWYYEPILDNRPGFFKWLRLNITELRAGTTFDLAELEIYGKLRNLTTGVAGFKTPGDRFDNLLNVDTYNPRNNREIIYDASTGIWESRINQPWDVKNITMDNDLVLSKNDLRNPRFYILSPNGQARNVFLPPPTLNDAIKFRSLDGLFDINIYEYDLSVLNNQLESYWKFDNTATDELGNNDLTIFATSYQTGLIGNEIVFSGAGNSRAYSNSFTQAPGSFAFSMWVSFDTLSVEQTICSRWRQNSALSIFTFRITADNNLQFITTKDGSTFDEVQTSNWNPVTATRYHLVITYNAATGAQEIYVDNVLEAANTFDAGPINDNTLQFAFATEQDLSQQPDKLLDGTIDEAAYYLRHLRSSDVDLLYNSGAAIDYDIFSVDAPITPVVLNNAGKLQYEYVYDGVEFHVIG